MEKEEEKGGQGWGGVSKPNFFSWKNRTFLKNGIFHFFKKAFFGQKLFWPALIIYCRYYYHHNQPRVPSTGSNHVHFLVSDLLFGGRCLDSENSLSSQEWCVRAEGYSCAIIPQWLSFNQCPSWHSSCAANCPLSFKQLGSTSVFAGNVWDLFY